MSDRWAFRQRQEWIAESVRIFGFINRAHLEKKFEISTPQASADLKAFQKANPGVIEYNASDKRYEDAVLLKHARDVNDAYSELIEDLQNLCSEFGCLGGEHRINWLRTQLTFLRDMQNNRIPQGSRDE